MDGEQPAVPALLVQCASISVVWSAGIKHLPYIRASGVFAHSSPDAIFFEEVDARHSLDLFKSPTADSWR